MGETYAVEMLNITKRFPGIVANDDITLRLKKGEIHALLGENGAGKSTLMSVLFGLYQAEEGVIKKDGNVVQIRDPNDANDLGIGMVHQHFKLVDCFTVLDNIILGVEPCKLGFLQKKEAREKVVALSEKYGLFINPDMKIEEITVGMQQRTEILKMLYRDNEILIFDEPTAVLTPQEINELMKIMLSFLDRMFSAGNDSAFAGKPAACIAVARRAGTSASLDALMKYPAINAMPIVTSTYWPMLHDQNGNGLMDENETVLPGVQVQISANAAGVEPQQVTTDDHGTRCHRQRY